MTNKSNQLLEYRAVHLDLKGTPPTPQRLIELLHVFAAAKYNTVVVEWENMFPWNIDEQFRTSTAYSPQEIEAFYNTAAELSLKIIPLVQTLGHMETFLTPSKYHPLREQAGFSNVLNPLAKGAKQLVQSLIEEILERTPHIQHLHIGGDEAWSLGTHDDTKQFIKAHSKAELFLSHIVPILELVNSKGVRPIMWHDMITDFDQEHLLTLKDKTDVVIWGYCDSPYNTKLHHNMEIIEKFSKMGFQIWGASAYKGADGGTADVPDFQKRKTNALGWVKAAKEHNFKGMIATAWSRYSTFWPQCETAYAALDILYYMGILFNDGTPPENELDDCRKALDKIPQASLFKSTHDAMQKVADARKIAYEYLCWLNEQIALGNHSSNYKSSHAGQMLIDSIPPLIKELEDACNNARTILSESTYQVWADEYADVRIKAVQNSFARLKQECVR